MVETLGYDNIDRINDLQNDVNEFSFDRSLLEAQESGNNALIGGFIYDENGCIICENNPFKKEDYNNLDQPIDKLLGGMMKEGEYWGIDYSKCNNLNEVKQTYKSSLIFIKKVNGHIIIDGNEYYPIAITEGIRIIPPHKDFMDFIGYEGIREKITIISETDEGDDDPENGFIETKKRAEPRLNEKIGLVAQFNELGISFNDLKEFFGKNKDESEIFDFLNSSLYENIDESKKGQIFGEYSDKIGEVPNYSGLLRMKLKNKVGNDIFYSYIGKFIEKINDDRKILINYILAYLLTQSCTITQNNIDKYINYINQGGSPVIGEYTLEEAILIKDYGFDMEYMHIFDADKKILKKIKDLEINGVTKDMVSFSEIYSTPNIDTIEELFINEKEGKNLFYFLSKYPQKLQNLGGKEIKEIELNTEKRNFCFRGILEMIKSRGSMGVLPYPGENADSNTIQKRKESWEIIIKEYEKALKDYISLDFYTNEQGERQQKEKSETFDKIFYSTAMGREDHNGAFSDSIEKQDLQLFSTNEIQDYSSTINENEEIIETHHREMIDAICNYASANEHKDEKILVYVGTHGAEDGRSANGRNKDDWLKISKYPNVKIMSTRCHFGSVYNSDDNGSGDYIYDQPSQLSGFSNKAVGLSEINGIIKEGIELGLGFHEMELYARLHYDIISPLTENLEYTDQLTGEKKQTNIGLAYNEGGSSFENIV